ncbi:MAG: hypothetical protein KF773_06595 [Deltaproteobacteria bacterium]|nr:hypothetical protein [Deltaproteobacteria bacterium]MCW5803342.1 hypothetical protein [Deltaproteobacteria bacterium]
MTTKLDTISLDSLTSVTGGAGPSGQDLLDAGKGALNMFKNPIGAAYNFGKGLGGARAQGHSWGDSFANGLVQSAGTFKGAPNLANIPAK